MADGKGKITMVATTESAGGGDRAETYVSSDGERGIGTVQGVASRQCLLCSHGTRGCEAFIQHVSRGGHSGEWAFKFHG